MTTKPTPCDLVAERIALGEPLAELDAHAESCEHCQRLAALPGALVATGHGADPGIGFASRVTAGAQHRLVVRRRRRITAMSATSLAAAAALALVVARPASEPNTVAFTIPSLDKYKPAIQPAPNHDPGKREIDPDVRALVHLANIDRDLHTSANWARIERPLRPYRAVLRGKLP